MHNDQPIAVMDATCALCSFGARMIHRLDRSGDIRICPIQTDKGRLLLAAQGLDALDPDSWLFIEGPRVYHNFDAVIRVGERCGGFGRILSVLRLLPKGTRNWLYYTIARNRYRLFGRGDMCAIPDESFQRRLMQ
ncbi:Predicted thiol-disulfide oxidoreductase YuxK, DCC family [Cognatiyoonia koreensis]|uniref:Predicted thiol-disulfide oxidoreductase YuxK, DCC family n=1 Tax=Cognatiyoonia koreensis TaxID=364200 RepID=A0A1I0N8Y4_9RHOB|nr:DCC1-like thiol-disulfide oxidoreductase family protein [Cognatiyoonia koreensis]SEV97443.1 Predicted thiol-disulfide oxidoreductase YuxK, DCC family [Cognatiyoonia koreensis]